MKKAFLFVLLYWISVFAPAFAQTNPHDLLNIKDQADAMRLDWLVAFDEGVDKKDLKGLAPLSEAYRNYINDQYKALRKQHLQGDAAPLLVAIKNYFSIHQQFADRVVPQAQQVDVNDQEAVDEIRIQLNNYAQKEKALLVDLDNAIRAMPNPRAGSARTNLEVKYEDAEPEERRRPEEAGAEADEDDEPDPKPGKKKKSKKKTQDAEEQEEMIDRRMRYVR